MAVADKDRAYLSRLGSYKDASHAEGAARHGALPVIDRLRRIVGSSSSSTALPDETIATTSRAASTTGRGRAASTVHERRLAVEDLIVVKLIADRPKDQIDLGGLLALAHIDWAYVERCAGEWGVLERLQALRGA